MAATDSVTPDIPHRLIFFKGHRLKSPLVNPHNLEASSLVVRFTIASIAQRIRATGFYPVCGRFESYWGHAVQSMFSQTPLATQRSFWLHFGYKIFRNYRLSAQNSKEEIIKPQKQPFITRYYNIKVREGGRTVGSGRVATIIE